MATTMTSYGKKFHFFGERNSDDGKEVKTTEFTHDWNIVSWEKMSSRRKELSILQMFWLNRQLPSTKNFRWTHEPQWFALPTKKVTNRTWKISWKYCDVSWEIILFLSLIFRLNLNLLWQLFFSACSACIRHCFYDQLQQHWVDFLLFINYERDNNELSCLLSLSPRDTLTTPAACSKIYHVKGENNFSNECSSSAKKHWSSEESDKTKTRNISTAMTSD